MYQLAIFCTFFQRLRAKGDGESSLNVLSEILYVPTPGMFFYFVAACDAKDFFGSRENPITGAIFLTFKAAALVSKKSCASERFIGSSLFVLLLSKRKDFERFLSTDISSTLY